MDDATKHMIQRAIVDRSDAVVASCNSGHISHNEGVVRGLLWALTGEDPGAHVFNRYSNLGELLVAADVPMRALDDHIHYMIGGTPEETEVELWGECDICRAKKVPEKPESKKVERSAFDRALHHYIALGRDTDDMLIPALRHDGFVVPKMRIAEAIARLTRDGLVRVDDKGRYEITETGWLPEEKRS